MSEQVNRLLWDVLGYRKIEQLLAGEKSPDQDIRDFLDGTVFATFGASSMRGERRGGHIQMPFVPKIRRTSDAEVRSDGSEVRLVYSNRTSSLPVSFAPYEGAPYHISNDTFFRYTFFSDVVKYFEGLQGSLFPEAKIEKDVTLTQAGKLATGVHAVTIHQPGLYLTIEGPQRRKAPRRLNILFDTDQATVEQIDSIVSRYFGMIEAPHRENQTRKGGPTIYPDLAAIAADLNNSGTLEEELTGCTSRPYDMGTQYQVGAVLSHPRFGMGIVVETTMGRMQVYFTEKGKKPLLNGRK